MKILVVNGGSSSFKISLFDLKDDQIKEPLWEGIIDWGMNLKNPLLKIKTSSGKTSEQLLKNHAIEEGITIILHSLCQGEAQVIEGLSEIEKIGHRVVHGGPQFAQPALITASVKNEIRRLIPLAPLHNPANLQGIEWMEKFFPSIPQIAVFDTAFHLSMPEMIKTYPVPYQWKEKGIQRFGFHGISHQYCAERAALFLDQSAADLKIINCHLGNGCSICAIKDGKSYETSMGMTPLEGLMMGTRCGSIDPGILLYLMREHNFSQQDLDHALNFESGLKGIAGHSDMRELLEQKGNARVDLALDMFVHRLASFIGALAVSLEGFNVLSFTGGIGENAESIRSAACKALACFNIRLDENKNRNCRPDADANIAALSSEMPILVLHTREDWMIARECLSYL